MQTKPIILASVQQHDDENLYSPKLRANEYSSSSQTRQVANEQQQRGEKETVATVLISGKEQVVKLSMFEGEYHSAHARVRQCKQNDAR